ncbi:T9SS type A sorting domain-containing protein [candidate division KSB1 bacterium]|nr:T9SS type A sorting domain-containing protein [candidate division KSB1 bacterium]RQW01902.1 MAG: T9SS C-terminal target domain-containing protein [candidate division KSB1 bacterium]
MTGKIRQVVVLSLFVIHTTALAQKSAADQQLLANASHHDNIEEALLEIADGVLELYQFLRNDIGVYADAARFAGAQFHPCSIASVGMGLISLCIADSLQLSDAAQAQALQTLRAMSGEVPGYEPARNPVNGFFRHWISLKTGAREWNSEYSSIDTAILICGALFCKSYFSDAEIARLADALYLSMDWNAATADAGAGEIYMTFHEDGSGELKTRPFNEYMIVAWLAKNDPRANAQTKLLWHKFFENASALPNSIYNGIPLLADSPGQYLSNFVIQFPMYLCSHFTSRQDYRQFLKNAMHVDRQWWSDNTNAPLYVWGTGAGASGFVGSGYHADNFRENPGHVCSPHVLAGFAPVDSTVFNDVLELWNNNVGVYSVPGSTKKFLWRFSVQDLSWRAADVQGVDISTLLFGLATHPALLGKEFFAKYNDYVFPSSSDVKKKCTLENEWGLQVHPNPFNSMTTIRCHLQKSSSVVIELFDVRGYLLRKMTKNNAGSGDHTWLLDGGDLSSGIYIVRLQVNDTVACRRLVCLR